MHWTAASKFRILANVNALERRYELRVFGHFIVANSQKCPFKNVKILFFLSLFPILTRGLFAAVNIRCNFQLYLNKKKTFLTFFCLKFLMINVCSWFCALLRIPYFCCSSQDKIPNGANELKIPT